MRSSPFHAFSSSLPNLSIFAMISKLFFSLLALVVTVPLQVCQAQIAYNSQTLEFQFNLYSENPTHDPTNPENWKPGGWWQIGWSIVDPNAPTFDLKLGWVNPDEGNFVWTEILAVNLMVSETSVFFPIPKNVHVPYTYQLVADFKGAAVNAVSQAFELTP
ncbi:hypothetical protein JVU11DRAFT_9724 [Chiua virens]|nr:hypothetical protein JVU11DRAFT_9724 [Chiua virens]